VGIHPLNLTHLVKATAKDSCAHGASGEEKKKKKKERKKEKPFPKGY